jgi:hypothetical protein
MTVHENDRRILTTAFGVETSLPSDEKPRPTWFHTFWLQAGHRAASMAFFLVLVVVVAFKLEKWSYTVMLPAVAFALADLALVSGVVALWISSRRRVRKWESIGIIVFSFLVALAAGWLAMSYYRNWWPMPATNAA